jgi:hypothetical protein
MIASFIIHYGSWQAGKAFGHLSGMPVFPGAPPDLLVGRAFLASCRTFAQHRLMYELTAGHYLLPTDGKNTKQLVAEFVGNARETAAQFSVGMRSARSITSVSTGTFDDVIFSPSCDCTASISVGPGSGSAAGSEGGGTNSMRAS